MTRLGGIDEIAFGPYILRASDLTQGAVLSVSSGYITGMPQAALMSVVTGPPGPPMARGT